MNQTKPNTKNQNSALLNRTDLQDNWYILYTSPRAEKVVYAELLKREYSAFLPMSRTLRMWRNRQKKWINEVLFPSYVFVNTNQHELYNIKQVPKVVTYLHYGGKPSIMPLKDIEGIQKMLSLEQDVIVDNDFKAGEYVRIAYGPLAGFEGFLVKKKGKTRFGIQLKEISQTMFIDICTSVLEKTACLQE